MKRREIRERDEAAERERLEARTEGLLAQLKANEAARNAPDAPPPVATKPAEEEPTAEEPPVSEEPSPAEDPAEDPAEEPAADEPVEGEPS